MNFIDDHPARSLSYGGEIAQEVSQQNVDPCSVQSSQWFSGAVSRGDEDPTLPFARPPLETERALRRFFMWRQELERLADLGERREHSASLSFCVPINQVRMFCPGHAVIDQVILRQHFDNPLRMRIEHEHLGEDAARGFYKELSVRREVIGEWKEALRDELSCRCG